MNRYEGQAKSKMEIQLKCVLDPISVTYIIWLQGSSLADSILQIDGHLTFRNLGHYVRYRMVMPTVSRKSSPTQCSVCCDNNRTPVIF